MFRQYLSKRKCIAAPVGISLCCHRISQNNTTFTDSLLQRRDCAGGATVYAPYQENSPRTEVRRTHHRSHSKTFFFSRAQNSYVVIILHARSECGREWRTIMRVATARPPFRANVLPDAYVASSRVYLLLLLLPSPQGTIETPKI